MGDVPVAAFDPIFYAHHWYDRIGRPFATLLTGASNIDRLWAVWQVLYPDSWFTSQDAPGPQSSLEPFHHDFSGSRGVDYFNSDDTRDWQGLGYQYDVLQRNQGETDPQYQARIKAWIDATYPHTGNVLTRDKHRLLGDVKDNTYDDYVVNLLYDR